MILLLILSLQSALPVYSVSVDPVQLQYLYDHFQDGIEIPAVISRDTLTSECTLSFRGGASLNQVKKSWHIRLTNGNVFPEGEHILLCAQVLDAALMRNTLGHTLTRELGFPATETEFVALSINGTNMGVYERLERVDRRFFERNGFGFGPLFKSITPLARLLPQYAGLSGINGFEPKVDGKPYSDQLVELIEDCFRGDVSSLVVEEFIALYAVKTAIYNRDAVIKNFYLHLWQDRWHIYPWDRDASFGNEPGEYIEGWTTKSGMFDVSRSGVLRALFESWENVQMFNDFVAQSAVIMSEQFPELIDSLRLEIRNDLAEDPYYDYTILQFDSICTVLTEDIQERAIFLEGIYLSDSASVIKDYCISSCLDMRDEIEFTLALEGGDPNGVVLLLSVDGEDEEIHFIPESNDGMYSYVYDVPNGTYSVRVAFGPRIRPWNFPVYYPSWSFKDYSVRAVPAPAARVSLAALEPEYFVFDPPLWCGENLWVLPVVNTADFTQDLSLCSFLVGNPSGSIFFPESVLVEPFEDFYLTNNASLASEIFSGQIFGDAGTSLPVNSEVILNDPAWKEIQRWSLGNSDSVFTQASVVIPSEISMGDGSDWIELYNSGGEEVDLTDWYLLDSEKNTSYFPEGATIAVEDFFVVWEDFLPDMQGAQLDFCLNSTEDSLKLYNNLGDLMIGIGWDSNWPVNETGIIFLTHPFGLFSSQFSWAAIASPGTPGESNPGWEDITSFVNMQLASENPSNGAFCIHYQCSTQPDEALLYDLAGRVVAKIDLPVTLSGSINADFSGRLATGIYVVFLRSSTESNSLRLTVITDD